MWIRFGAMRPNDPFDCTTFAGEGYYAFYPATAALRQGLVAREGFCAEGMRLVPPIRRIASPFVRDGEPNTWKIATDAKIGTPFILRTRLTQAEARIPEAAIWNHAFLLDRLQSGWHPTLEADDGDAA